MCSLTADPKKGTPRADLLSWTRMVKKSSGLDNIMGLDGLITRLRASPSGTPFNVCLSSSRSDRPLGVPSEFLVIAS